jgi:G2/mitotic-specific cyclin-B, other
MNAGNGKRAAFRVSDIVSVVREISDAKCHGAGFWSFWLRRPPRAIFIQIDAVIASSRETTIYTIVLHVAWIILFVVVGQLSLVVGPGRPEFRFLSSNVICLAPFNMHGALLTDASCFIKQDVSNVGRVGNNKKRSTYGVKTRSMSQGRAPQAEAAPNHQAAENPRIKPDPNSYQVMGTTDDIDARDSDDPLCVTDYVQSIYEHAKSKEMTTSVRPLYMESQQHINERMRAILIDWLVEVHLKFKLMPETLYLTVNLIDRYLERKQVTRPRLQLVGVTCLLLASKYEEIYPPELRDLVYICDRAYSRQEIIDMEEKILKTLEYNLTVPTAHNFLVRYLKAGHADKTIVQMSCFLLDGTLQAYPLLHYVPSQLAAACVFISRRVAGRNGWSPTLLTYSDYCEEEVIPVARALLTAKQNASKELKAVYKKYTSPRYANVADSSIPLDF